MSKKLFLALSLLAPLAAASPAIALKTNHQYTVQFDGSTVGYWNLRNLVAPTANGCQYTVKWSDLTGPPLGRTVLCKIDELDAGDDFDCQEAAKSYFDTVVEKGGSCKGFDDFGQETNITTLIGGESSDGSISGVVEVASVGDAENLTVF
jgi:hypothetical protein